jgi:hypothetical protein
LFNKKYLQYLILFSYLSISTYAVFNITKQTYGVNDDVIIENWLSGFYTGTPELMIRGSATPRISFGFVVSNLYALDLGINWFSIILLGLTLFGWFLLGVLAFRSKNSLVIVIYYVISFLHLLWFIPSPTYTAAAVTVSFSTMVYLLKKISENSINIYFIAVSLVYVFGFLIRPESFLLGSVATLPFIVFTVLKNKQIIRKRFKIIITSIILVFTIIGIDVAFEKIYYKNNANWTEYKNWEIARYKIQANAPEKAVLENPVKFGWTKAESEIFKNYNSIDYNKFTANKLNQLILDSKKTTKIDFKFVTRSHQQIFDSDINWEWKRLIQLISLVFLTFLLLSFPKCLNYLLLSAPAFVILYAVMLYVAGFLRQPERVQVSVIFLAILISWSSFLFSNERENKNELKHFRIMSWLVFILVVSSSFNQASYLKIKRAAAPNVFWQTQQTYLSKFPNDSIFVGNASQFRNNWISPYNSEHSDVEKRILSFGWHNFSPHWVRRAKNMGLDSNNMLNSIIQDSRVYWVSDPDSMEYIVSYMKEQNYRFSGPDIVGEMEYVGNEYKVWNFNPSE